MKTFLFKLLIYQTIIYALLWCMCCIDGLTHDGWKPMIITFYSLSVLTTFIIPIIKQFKKKQYGKQNNSYRKSINNKW